MSPPVGAVNRGILGSEAGVAQTILDVIDDFEDGDLSEYSGDVSSFDVQGATVYDGSFALEYAGTAGTTEHIRSHSGLPNYPAQGDRWEYRHRIDASADRATFVGFARQSDSFASNGYELRAEIDDAELRFGKRNGGFTILHSEPISWPTGEWLRIETDWYTTGKMSVAVFDATGSQLIAFSVTDTDYTSGGIELFAASDAGTAWWDECLITADADGLGTGFQRIAETSSYDHESTIIEAANGDLLSIYRSGTQHTVSTGSIVYRRSTDGGITWGSETVIGNEDEENRNPSAFIDPGSDNIIVFWRSLDDTGTYQDTLYTYSTDNGITWSTPTAIQSELTDTTVPFGGAATTTNGLLTLFYGDGGLVEGLFSTDNGQTWGDVVTVLDTRSTSGKNTSESTPVATSESNIIVYGREAENNEFYSVTSSDGGSTWGSVSYFNIESNQKRTPIFGNKTGTDEITVTFNWRSSDNSTGYIYATRMSASAAFNDPPSIANEAWTRLQVMQASNVEDHGYPTVTRDGRFIAFHDDDTPNIYFGKLSI